MRDVAGLDRFQYSTAMSRQDLTLFGLAIGPSFAFVAFLLLNGVRGRVHIPWQVVPFVVIALPIITVAIGLELRRRRDAKSSNAPETPESQP
jgi:uncharacterized membrane protein YhaH (DUF805 family)